MKNDFPINRRMKRGNINNGNRRGRGGEDSLYPPPPPSEMFPYGRYCGSLNLGKLPLNFLKNLSSITAPFSLAYIFLSHKRRWSKLLYVMIQGIPSVGEFNILLSHRDYEECWPRGLNHHNVKINL